MRTRDYYTELEVPSDADDTAIKKAYRKLARQYHPDITGDDQTAEDRFKAINEAYQTLSDPQKRKRYDELRRQSGRWQPFHGGEASWEHWPPMPGARIYSGTIAPEVVQNIITNSDMFADILGSAFRAETGSSQQARPRRGQDIELSVDVTLAEAWHGSSRAIHVGDRRVEATIPAGIRDGSRIRLAGQGAAGADGGAAGDLYLSLHLLPDARFERDGDNLLTSIPLDIFTAVSGGTVEVPTLNGSALLSIPACTQSGQQFRLKGKGMPRLNQPDQYGDLYVSVQLVLPESLSHREMDILGELARQRKQMA